jgi:hypothetical protein
VAVVLPAEGTARAAAFLAAADELAQLAEDRGGDVADVRSVVPDDPEFVPDVAALLADQGTDLVCVLGEDGVPVVLQLADRFPATRFCAIGEPGTANRATSTCWRSSTRSSATSSASRSGRSLATSRWGW